MSQSLQNTSIAIIGMACRYPDADTTADLFENSLAQRRSFRRIPDSRLAALHYFDPTGKVKDRSYVHKAALLKNFSFDKTWFRISQRSFEVTDLTHWLALTVAKEAIEDIRFYKNESHPKNEMIRVVVGNTLTGEFSRANLMRLRWPYVRRVVAQQLLSDCPDLDETGLNRILREMETRYKQPFPVPNEDSLAGGLANTIAGRICNHFDFKGGGYTVDGACSSSLLAVTDACTALMCGDADMVLTGGVDLSIDPFELVGFSRSSALARREMRVYDKRSEGFWPGEGCGFVALMRLEDALEQCRHIYAVIRGWGISSDGRGGLTRPEPEGQMLALERCYKRAGYGIESVGLFEGHGTGTRVGDDVELRALITARRRKKRPITPAVISSIKANIGHTKAAAGLASLIRTSMCLYQKILPPTTGCQQPHDLLVEQSDNLTISNRLRYWESDRAVRRAGISTMGFGGINTHVTLEEAPSRNEKIVRYPNGFNYSRLKSAHQDTELFLLCAQTRKDMLWTIDHLYGFTEACSFAELTDLAVELGNRATFRRRILWKAAIVAGTPSALRQKLSLVRKNLPDEGDERHYLSVDDNIYISHGDQKGRIGFIFSGQGSPVRVNGGFHANRFDTVAGVYQMAGLENYETHSGTDFAQPAITAASLAGLRLVQDTLGVHADVAVGHSLGELSALHWAGAFDEGSVLEIAKIRGRIMADDPDTSGGMAAIKLNLEQTEAAIGTQDGIAVANINAPEQTVVSGKRQVVQAFVETLQRGGITATMLPVKQAFHTPSMSNASKVFRQELSDFTSFPLAHNVISTVTGKPILSATHIGDYLSRQLVAPVRYLEAIQAIEQEVDLFMEIGPGQLMANLTRSFCDTPIVALDIGGESIAPFLNAAAAAYVLNCTPGIRDIFMERYARPFDWHWNHTRFIENPCETLPEDPKSELAEAPEEPVAETAGPTDIIPGKIRTIDLLRQTISEHTGLPKWTIDDNSRMLSELHLNSITVGEIVAKMTAAQKIPIPADITVFANSSIREIADALDALKTYGEGQSDKPPKVPAGVDTWIRYFGIKNIPSVRPEPLDGRVSGVWEGFGKITPFNEDILHNLNTHEYGNGVIVWIGTHPTIREIQSLLQAAKHCIERKHSNIRELSFVVVQAGRGASAFIKSFHLENPAIRTLILNIAAGLEVSAPLILSEIKAATPQFCEVFIDEDKRRHINQLCKFNGLPAAETTPIITQQDIVAVTGGGKGITAECAYQLALRTGCALLIIGRSSEKENKELANNLARFRQAGLRVNYQIGDVSMDEDIRNAINKGVAELGGPITAVIHGAGINAPRRVENLTMGHIQLTLNPKIDGLKNLIAVIDPHQLKLLVTFGSIIGRMGLAGEADYALANEWLSHDTEKFQAQYPHCRCYSMEWSLWSGAGIGQKLGRVELLADQGISPITLDTGVKEFLRLINTPNLPVSIIITSRFGQLPTAVSEAIPLDGFRFINTISVYYPEIELIADCTVSPQSDFYLDDHRLNGTRVFPAVMALEAMTEAAVVLMQAEADSVTPLFHDVRFRKAIMIRNNHNENPSVIRIAALNNDQGEISFAIRCSETNFQINHIEARCILQPDGSVSDAASFKTAPVPGNILQPFNPNDALYDNILFQSGRFQRISGYHIIEARRCCGQISLDNGTLWFADDLPRNLLMGDPGARDAALHGIQACIPHKIVIPVSVEKIECGRIDSATPHYMFAGEIADNGHELIYNMTIFDQKDQIIETWHNLTLRVIETPSKLKINSPLLIVPFFERRAADINPQADVKLSIVSTTSVSGNHSSRAFIATPSHRPDGKPDPHQKRHQSFSYSDSWRLTASSVKPVGCDLQTVRHNPEMDWVTLLGSEGFTLAEIASEMFQEPLDISATRVWTAREAMKKAGIVPLAPLTIAPESSARWAIFESGSSQIFSSYVDAAGTRPVMCLTVALL